MSRVQLALNVADLDESIEFYTRLFQTGPAKVRENYANFSIAEPPLKLILFAAAGEPGSLNHIGVEVDSTAEVAAAIARATADGFDQTVQDNVSCCFAVQDKTWVHGPDNVWEFYTVLDDAPTMGCDSPVRRLCGGDEAAASSATDRRAAGTRTHRPARRVGTSCRASPYPRPESADRSAYRDLTRRLAAEGVGTAFLVIAVIGSGVMASRLTDDTALQLLANAAATAGALIALIWMFGAVSGAHFNPAVTLVGRLFGTITPATPSPTRPPRWPAAASAQSSPTSCSTCPRSRCRPTSVPPAPCGSPRSSPPSVCCS